MIFEIFQYGFMIQALTAGLIMALLAGIVGNFVVAGRQAVLSDMLAHAALAGVGIGVFFDTSLPIAIFGVILLLAWCLWYLMRRFHYPPEAISMLILSGSLAVALLLTHLTKNNPISLENYLFGSILTVTKTEVILTAGLAFVVLAVVGFFWNELLVAVIDPVFAASRSRKAHYFELLFLLLVGLVVGLSLKIIGGLLVGAMLIIPSLSAYYFASSFRSSVFTSIIMNMLSVIVGLYVSFYFDVPASSAIVLSLIVMFGIVLISTKLKVLNV